MTDKQREVYEQMEMLVHKRTNELELEERLSEIFGIPIKVEDLTESNPDWTGDWWYAFNVCNSELQYESEEDKIGGFFDIYYLKTRENDYGDDFYITEVACDFCDY